MATVLKRAQLGHGINLPPEFHQNRPPINGVLAWTDRQTDITMENLTIRVDR